MRPPGLTWVGNADADVSALELSLAESKSLLQAVDGTELDIAETLGSAVHLVLNDANAGNLASVEEIADIGLGDFERKVAKVGSVRGLVGKRKLLTNGVTSGTVCRQRVSPCMNSHAHVVLPRKPPAEASSPAGAAAREEAPQPPEEVLVREDW